MTESKIPNNLFAAFLQLKTEKEVENFCKDLMTPQEIDSFIGRWESARKLNDGISQREVSKQTGTSIATVTRVNRFLKNGFGGYKLVLDRLSHSHSNSAMAGSQ